MKKTLLFIITALCVSLVTAQSQAEQWQIVGPRALGMGGAHVAVVNDATAQYWNPGVFGFFDEPLPGERDKKHKLKKKINNEKNKKAKEEWAKKQKDAADEDSGDIEAREKKAEELAEIKKGAALALEYKEEEGDAPEDWNGYSQRYFGLHLSAGGGVQILGDVVDEVDEIVDKDFETLFEKADSDAKTLDVSDIGEAIDIINDIKDLDDPDKGIIVMANSSVAVRMGHCAVGAYVLGEIATNMSIDLNNIGFFGAGADNAINALSDELIDAVADPVNGGVAPTSAGGLSASQEADLAASITSLGGDWAVAAAGDPQGRTNAQVFVDAADEALAADGRTASAEDIDTILLMAEIAGNAESGTGGGNFDDNQTSITFIGPVILEVPLTYGYAVNDYWSIGGNVKYMHGKIFFTKFTVFETDSDDILADAQRNSEESDYFGIDLGTLIRFSDFRIGFVGRNINEPRFDYETDEGEGKTWRLNPQVRAGIAYMPCDWFTLSVDGDLTRNKTVKEDYFSQLVSTGVEFNIFNFLALRGGFYSNVGDNTDHDEFVYTAGLGLNIFGIHLDAGAAMSESRSELDGQRIPDEVRAEVALSAQF